MVDGTDFSSKARNLLAGKPTDFDANKDWGDFQVAVRNATKSDGFLRPAAGFVTTLTAIVGVWSSVITAQQLRIRDSREQNEADMKYRFDALSLYTNHWKEFNSIDNCPHFTVFAETIKERAQDLSKAIYKDWSTLCGRSSGEAQATADFKPGQVNGNSSYETVQQVTPTSLADAPSPALLVGLTVFIQYKANKDEANAVQALTAQLGAKAPGTQAVAKVPPVNQIRMYKDAQQPLADQLQAALKSKLWQDFDIVSLQPTYPNLPANHMEVWLKD